MSRGIALLFLGPMHYIGCWDQSHAPVVSTPGKDLLPIEQEAGWDPGPVWTGAEYQETSDNNGSY